MGTVCCWRRGAWLWAGVVLLTAGVAGRAAGEAAPLVADGKSDYVIVARAGASASERRGADELRAHLLKLTGATLAVATDEGPLPPKAILVGQTRHTRALAPDLAAAALGDEGYALKTVGPHLVVAGSDVRGAMYGCTALLEKLGVRFYTPTVTWAPPVRTLALPALDEARRPAFEYREAYCTEALGKDWAARLRLNGQHHALDDSTGGKVRYSHFVHTFDELVPRELFAAHPEYFPIVKGKRVTGYVQRCLTNPEVLRLATERVMEWIAADPGALIYSVSQNDTYNFCECDACRAAEAKYGGTHSGLYLWFANAVAEAVERKHPGKLIDTLAYQFTEAPPAPGTIKPRANVRVRLCPIACCNAHPYDQCAAGPTVAFLANLRGWAALTDTLYVWHYNTNFAGYLMPFPDFGEFPAEVRLYAASGVKGIFFEGAYGPGGGGSFAELQAYVMAHLMWEPQADARAMVAEWHRGVFGAAAPPMQAWFDLLHDKVKGPADPHAHFFIYTNARKANYLSPDVVRAGDALFDRAEALAKANPAAAAYVAKARLGLRFVKLVQAPTTGDELARFVDDLTKMGVGHVREGGPVDAWERQYRKANAGK